MKNTGMEQSGRIALFITLVFGFETYKGVVAR